MASCQKVVMQAVGGLEQVNLYEFKSSLVCRASWRTVKDTEKLPWKSNFIF